MRFQRIQKCCDKHYPGAGGLQDKMIHFVSFQQLVHGVRYYFGEQYANVADMAVVLACAYLTCNCEGIS